MSEEAKWAIVLASYNAGLTTVVRNQWLRDSQQAKHYPEVVSTIFYPETRNYVQNISSKLFGLKHVVKKGDSLSHIANKYDVDLNTLIKSVGSETIYPEQVISLK